MVQKYYFFINVADRLFTDKAAKITDCVTGSLCVHINKTKLPSILRGVCPQIA